MVGTLEVITVAFVAQFTVLPGEKVQFIIASLATKYDPWTVVGAAGTAFAAWTAVEIAVGEALRQALPGIVLDGLTAMLFLLFAGLLFRSAPRPGGSSHAAASPDGGLADGGAADISIAGYDLPQPTGGFVPIFVLMAVGEFGDKTQLVTIGLAAQFGAHPGIWVGEMLAIIPVSIANALFFHRFAGWFDDRLAHLGGAAIFLFFGLDTLLSMATGVSVWETGVEVLTEMVLALG